MKALGIKRTTSNLQKRRSSEVNKMLLIGNKRGKRVSVDQCDPDTKEIIASFETAIEASKSVRIHPSGITSVCKGKQKTAGGFFWKYYSVKED
jgi:hypothetical protein